MMYMYPFIHTKARRLTRRFFDGNTSLSEERWLEHYYAGLHVCRDLQAYRPMFVGLQTLRLDDETLSSRCADRTVWRRWAAAAAVACLLAGGGWRACDLWRYHRLEICYGCSYYMEGGKRTEDLRKLGPHIQQTLTIASQMEAEVAQTRQIEEELLNSVTDERQREMLRRMLQ